MQTSFRHQQLYNRFLILFAILFISHILLFMESLLLIWIHFTGMFAFPEGRNYLPIPYFLISENWQIVILDVYTSHFIRNVGLGTAMSYLYFYYDKYYCKFLMKGIPALLNLIAIIIKNLFGFSSGHFIYFLATILQFIAILLVCIDFILARKSMIDFGILFTSFIGANIFIIGLSIITMPLIIILQPYTQDDWLLSFLWDLVWHVGYYSIIIIGIFAFIRKMRQKELQIITNKEDTNADPIE